MKTVFFLCAICWQISLVGQQYRLVYEEHEITDRYQIMSQQLSGESQSLMYSLGFAIHEYELLYTGDKSIYRGTSRVRYPAAFDGERHQVEGGAEFYKDHGKKITLKWAPLLNEDCLERKIDPLSDYEITDSVKVWQDYIIQKAVRTDKPSTYVWYCPALPLPEGPETMAGFPGLVVEYRNAIRHYQLVSIEEDSSIGANTVIKPPCEKSVDRETYRAANRGGRQ